MSIRFGTSGWRAIIADEFTFDNVRRVTEAICGYLTTEKPAAGQTLIIGCDSRFMGEKFSAVAAEIASTKGFRVLLCTGQTPTPAISYAIRSLGASGALNFTASHNPPEYQGIKFSTSDGAPALPELTSRIEGEVADMADFSAPGDSSPLTPFDPAPAYLADLAAKVSAADVARGDPHFSLDFRFGTS